MCLSLLFIMSCYCLINPHFARLQQERRGLSLSFSVCHALSLSSLSLPSSMPPPPPLLSLSLCSCLRSPFTQILSHTSDLSLRTHPYLYNCRNAFTKIYLNVCINRWRGGGRGPLTKKKNRRQLLVCKLVTPVALPALLYLRQPVVYTGELLSLLLQCGSSFGLRGKGTQVLTNRRSTRSFKGVTFRLN